MPSLRQTIARDRAWLRKELTEQLPVAAALCGMFVLGLAAAWFLLPENKPFVVLPQLTLNTVLATCVLLLPASLLPAGSSAKRRTAVLARLPGALGSGWRSKFTALVVTTAVVTAIPTAIALAMSWSRYGLIDQATLFVYGGWLGATALLVWTLAAGCQVPSALLALPCVSTGALAALSIGVAGLVVTGCTGGTEGTLWIIHQNPGWALTWLVIAGIGASASAFRTAFGRERRWYLRGRRQVALYGIAIAPAWVIAAWVTFNESSVDPAHPHFAIRSAIVSADGERVYLTASQVAVAEPTVLDMFHGNASQAFEIDLDSGVIMAQPDSLVSSYVSVSSLDEADEVETGDTVHFPGWHRWLGAQRAVIETRMGPWDILSAAVWGTIEPGVRRLVDTRTHQTFPNDRFYIQRFTGESSLRTTRGERIRYDPQGRLFLAVGDHEAERRLPLPEGLAPHDELGNGFALYRIDAWQKRGCPETVAIYDVARERTFEPVDCLRCWVRPGRWLLQHAPSEKQPWKSVFTSFDPETREQREIETYDGTWARAFGFLPDGSVLWQPDPRDWPVALDLDDHSTRPLGVTGGWSGHLRSYRPTASGRLPLHVPTTREDGSEASARILLLDEHLDHVETARFPRVDSVVLHITDHHALVLTDFKRIERLHFDGETREVLWPRNNARD